MTVEELIEELKQMPPTAVVAIEEVPNDWELEPVKVHYARGYVLIVADEFKDTSSEFLQQ